MSAMTAPGRPTPAVRAPTVMIVAAWVSWVLFSVTVAPARVVAVSESGIWPTMSEPGRHAAVAAGFISTPTPISAVEGPRKIRATASASSFFITTRLAQRSGLSSSERRSRRHRLVLNSGACGAQAMNTVNDTGRVASTGSVPHMPARCRVPVIV